MAQLTADELSTILEMVIGDAARGDGAAQYPELDRATTAALVDQGYEDPGLTLWLPDGSQYQISIIQIQ